MSGGAIVTLLIAAFFAGASMMFVERTSSLNVIRHAAIENGCAQYDAKTGAFKWKANP